MANSTKGFVQIKWHWETYGLRWFLFSVQNVGISDSITKAVYTYIGEDVLSCILFIFTLSSSCYYQYCLPVSNKGNVLPEKSDLKPISPENCAFQFFPVLVSLYSMKKRQKFSIYTLVVNFCLLFFF